MRQRVLPQQLPRADHGPYQRTPIQTTAVGGREARVPTEPSEQHPKGRPTSHVAMRRCGGPTIAHRSQQPPTWATLSVKCHNSNITDTHIDIDQRHVHRGFFPSVQVQLYKLTGKDAPVSCPSTTSHLCALAQPRRLPWVRLALVN